MSADREPTAVEVIAEALFGTYGQEDHHRSRSIALHALAALKAAGFVVARERPVHRPLHGFSHQNGWWVDCACGWRGVLWSDGLGARREYEKHEREVQP